MFAYVLKANEIINLTLFNSVYKTTFVIVQIVKTYPYFMQHNCHSQVIIKYVNDPDQLHWYVHQLIVQ